MAKKKKNKTCSPPGGLGVTRSRNAYTFSWSGGYDDCLYLQYALFVNGVFSYSPEIKLGANTTSYTIYINEGSYYPYGPSLTHVTFRVKGLKKDTNKINYKMSGYSAWAGINVYAPNNPIITYERNSQYRATFTINHPDHVTDREYYSNFIEYRTALRINTNETSGSAIPEDAWSPIDRVMIYNPVTQSDVTSFTRVVNDEASSIAIEGADSAVRWVAARTVGPATTWGWVYSCISYTEPYPAEITKATAIENQRNGYDCTVNFNYQLSISRPIDTIKVQYAFASPGGVYAKYDITKDTEIVEGKTYYTLTPTLQPEPIADKLYKYYEKIESYYSPTDIQSDGIDSEKIYYQAEEVSNPIDSGLDNYWEYIITQKTVTRHIKASTIDGALDTRFLAHPRLNEEVINQLLNPGEYIANIKHINKPYLEQIKTADFFGNDIDVTIKRIVNYKYTFSRTTDNSVDSTKTYYTISEVSNPTIAGLPETGVDRLPTHYIFKNKTYFKKTEDIVISKHKKYYETEASLVLNPDSSHLYEYYDLVETNYLAPINPSWQDAEIGSDNTIVPSADPGVLTTYSRAATFSVDGGAENDQLMYVRVNTVYNQKTTNGAYYMCTDEQGKVIEKETLLSEPTIDEYSWGTTNHMNVTITNTSEAEGIRIAIVVMPPNSDDNVEVIGIGIPNSNNTVSAVVEIPPKYMETSFGIGAYAFVGQYSLSGRIEQDAESGSTPLGYDLYLVNALLKSKLVTVGGEIPVPPTNVHAEHIGNGNVLVTWDWNWRDADFAEVAWSDFSEALDSTTQPSTYKVPNSKSNRLIVRELETGKTWFFWVRLTKEENESIWSNVVFESLSSSPSIPTLELSRRYITLDETFIASWSYVSTDGTSQQHAEICLCDVNGTDVIYNDVIKEIPNDEVADPEVQYTVLDPSTFGWVEGGEYYLAVRVTSSSGMISEKWSDPVPITIVKSVNSVLESSSLYPPAKDYDPEETYSVGDYTIRRIRDFSDPSKEKGVLYQCFVDIVEPEPWNEDHWRIDPDQPYQELRSLPLTVAFTSDSDNSIYNLILERSQEFFLERPDGSTSNGHVGEVVAQTENSTIGSFTIEQDNLSSYLDDCAYYYMTTRVTDNYGQTSEVRYEFLVNWSHQALMPVATTTVDTEYSVIKISIDLPENIPSGDSIEGDVCDIYRQSAEGFTLLYSSAEFEQTYVDPYPTLGEHGGYRVCYRTRNGDTVAVDRTPAWIDLDDEEDMIQMPHHIIDYNGGTVELTYNVNIDNSWKKDFQETKYLGGSIQGDWNTVISKTTNMTCSLLTSEWDMISHMRALASYAGICHVRTREGSNFLANVEVTEKVPYKMYTDPQTNLTSVYEYTLSITRLDPIEPDGMTLEDWEDSINETGETDD